MIRVVYQHGPEYVAVKLTGDVLGEVHVRTPFFDDFMRGLRLVAFDVDERPGPAAEPTAAPAGGRRG